ncbi:hypothetical protein RHMOL_Rhmol07G0123800 [Rhododendron molle]|uniref:Uncharacterized protein n=1 Tax=Rhododendron molle TaxID=49168 RepID=A0ACC0N070_RHOML|nr:hypothetical protein RHMOL_Rhmol07G0123800 [Rhododendron molle]
MATRYDVEKFVQQELFKVLLEKEKLDYLEEGVINSMGSLCNWLINSVGSLSKSSCVSGRDALGGRCPLEDRGSIWRQVRLGFLSRVYKIMQVCLSLVRLCHW